MFYDLTALLTSDANVKKAMGWIGKTRGGGGGGVSKEIGGSVRLPVWRHVSSRVSDFQNGEQSVHRKRRIKISNLSRKYCSDFLDLDIVRFLLS